MANEPNTTLPFDAGYYSSLDDYGRPDGDLVNIDDDDSALGDNASMRTSLTESLTPSIMDYRFENGRRYHAYKDGYLQHHLWRLSLDGVLYLSPIPPSTTSVLDLGTGTGIWAIEFADEHPSVTVTGVDLSPVQPAWVPSNCIFQVDDIEAEWTYPLPATPLFADDPTMTGGGDGGFDFIHSRMLTMGVKDWPGVFQQSFLHLRPGGYFEAQEFDLAIRCEPHSPKQGFAFRKWSDSITEAARKAGIDTGAARRFGDQLRAAGFVDVEQRKLRWPVGAWPESKKEKTLGIWAQRNMLDGLEAVSMGLLSRFHGWSKEQILELVSDTSKEMNDVENFYQYCDIYVWFGRKPGSSSTFVPPVE